MNDRTPAGAKRGAACPSGRGVPPGVLTKLRRVASLSTIVGNLGLQTGVLLLGLRRTVVVSRFVKSVVPDSSSSRLLAPGGWLCCACLSVCCRPSVSSQ
jgi:hypothetical protein